MAKQVAVIGLGRFGTELARTLSKMGHDVLGLDTDEARVQGIAADISRAVRADATSEATLEELGIRNFDIAIVAVGSMIQVSVLATILLKRLGVPHLIARASNELHGMILDKIGADKVVYPEAEMGSAVAHLVNLRTISDFMPLALHYGVAKLIAPPSFLKRSLANLGFGPGGKWDVSVLIIQRGKDVIVTPGRAEIVKLGDTLIVSGADDKLEGLLADAEKTLPNE